jgi:hypothetical protein
MICAKYSVKSALWTVWVDGFRPVASKDPWRAARKAVSNALWSICPTAKPQIDKEAYYPPPKVRIEAKDPIKAHQREVLIYDDMQANNLSAKLHQWEGL